MLLRITGIVLFCLFFAFPAQARQHHHKHHRHHTHHHRAMQIVKAPAANLLVGWWNQPAVSYSAQYSVSRPVRYIAGRLICAVNVGAALAERGIKGTGSALALSYLHWGRSAGGPVPGAVIVSARRGGGHVAIVSRVDRGIVYAWNATGGQRGWREIPYRHHVLDYRVPG
jgi:hypothetical protein